MMQTAMLRQVMEHVAWADALVWGAVRATPAAAEDARVRTLLHHVLEVQAAYVALWHGAEPEVRGAAQFETLAALEAEVRRVHEAIARFMAAGQDWGRSVPIPWAALVSERLGHEARPASLADTLLQVAGHTAYHHGQVNARIRELGGEPPFVDYIIWTWAGRPPAQWPELSPST